MKNKKSILVIAIILIASFACSLISSGDKGTGAGGNGQSSSSSGSGKFNTEFPLPPKVENFMNLGDDAINYQTPMKLTDVVDFYRDEFEKAGYEERLILTVINDDTFNIVWDGHNSGKAIVVQGLDLGNGNVNVNVRFEDV